MMTKDEAIEKYLKEHEVLYVVTDKLSTVGEGVMMLWNIYPDLEHAMRWIKLCEEHYQKPEIYWEVSRLQIGEMIKRLVFEHKSGTGPWIREQFDLEIICR